MKDLWNECGMEQWGEFLLSLNLLGQTEINKREQLRCLYAVSNHAEEHYRKAYLKKPDGGSRCLLIPDPLLKTIQRNLLNQVLNGIPISPCATASHAGASIRMNSILHTGRFQVLKLDIKDFFGSITDTMVYTSVFII